MRNSSNTQTVYQQQTHKNHFQLRFLLLPWKIYSSPLRPSYQLLLARLYHFAKSTQNNVQASLQYLAEHYGTSYGVMRNVVYEARNAGLLASGSLSFIDLETFEMPPNSDDKEIYPPYLLIPEHALFHQDLTCAEQITYALLYYRVNSEDGSVRNPKKQLAETMGITVDALKWRIKKFEKAGLVEKRSEGNKHRLYLTHYPSFIQQKLSYINEKLSTDEAENGGEAGDKGGVYGDKGGVDGDTKGVWAVTHINNNIRNTDKNTATPFLKRQSFEQPSPEPTPERSKPSGFGTTCTVLEYGSEEYKRREMEREALAAMSRKRGDAIREAYMARIRGKTNPEPRIERKPPTTALNGLHSVKQLLNMR